MHIIDISWPISPSITEYKDRKTVALQPYKQFERDHVRETTITMHNHTGTHVDAPSHFLAEGGSLDTLLLETLIGPCRVLDLTHLAESITQQDLEPFDMQQGERILLKTQNSNCSASASFNLQFIYVRKDAADYLAQRRICSLGIDYLGIERNQPGHETHRILLEQGITIIEGLRLGHVDQGAYELYCLPLNLPELDGAPARAILIQKN